MLHATIKICSNYHRLIEEGTTFSSWISLGNLTERVQVDEGYQFLHLRERKSKRKRSTLVPARMVEQAQKQGFCPSCSPFYPPPAILFLSLDKYLLDR